MEQHPHDVASTLAGDTNQRFHSQLQQHFSSGSSGGDATTTSPGQVLLRHQPQHLADGDRPLWDMSSFPARFRSFTSIVSPLNLLKSNEDLVAAQALLYGRLSRSHLVGDHPATAAAAAAAAAATPSTRAAYATWDAQDQDARAALQLVDSAVHPETKQVVPKFFRRSAFLAFNTPLFLGIAMTPQTLPWVVGWQVVNQSYNAFSNYANRSSTEEGAAAELATNFALAVTAATAAAVVVKQSVSKLPVAITGNASQRGLLRTVAVRFAPAFAASVGSSVLNVLVVRKRELTDGVAVRIAPHGDALPVGMSPAAAKTAMSATLQSRAILPLLSLVLPPLAVEYLTRRGGAFARPMVRLPLVGLVVAVSQLVALPLSLAPWPWFMSARVGDLEPEIVHAAAGLGLGPDDEVYFNKGL